MLSSSSTNVSEVPVQEPVIVSGYHDWLLFLISKHGECRPLVATQGVATWKESVCAGAACRCIMANVRIAKHPGP